MALPPQDSDKSDGKPAEKPSDKTKASQEDVFMREVDDALREDELNSFFQSYGIPLLVVIVLGLAGLGGYLWWDARQEAAASERGEKYIVALDSLEGQDLDGADKKLAEIAADDGTASAVSATLLRAGIAMEQGRTEDAIKLYGEVSADEDAPQVYRDLANVREVAANFDEMEPQAVVDRLKPLAVPGNPWFGQAGELVGMAYLKQDKEDLAGPLFAKIARDEDQPQSLRGRARQLAGLLGVDAIDDVVGEEDEASEPDTPAEPDEDAG